MKLLITGGCGFLGSNLAAHALEQKYDVLVFDNLHRKGSQENLAWLQTKNKFQFIKEDTKNFDAVAKAVKEFQPDSIFHLAGQVAMTTSIANPRLDFETNALGTFNILEAVRQFSPQSNIIYSSTNKVYGDLEQYTYSQQETRYVCNEKPEGFDENVTLDFHSPYGCSKGSADQYMLDWSRMFGLKTAVFRHSSMYGGRQFATADQGWIGWFCQKAVETKLDILKEPFTISGNGKQVRDVLHAKDMVSLYFSCIKNIDKAKGNAFNIGGGFENSLSLLELFDYLEKILDIKLNYTKLPPRGSDQKVFIADIKKARKLIGWKPEVNYKEGIKQMLEWTKTQVIK
ncbi:NAD-dependent epimerase/dehydratase family protein [Endomicrobium proavitum]|uniref:NAD-dependent epimerase/dehydratase n=1 Tax=Endomicrobium proavitum TaxID=1408281 RepID=A0A0G3WJN5_9BACT|nr:NAD-dependent epimerase/dehydratase family protein [Endomicrobium proavitum]AKL97709.1 NAD-dependent epimerase/dehydratase [Endomicrobium proavitum]